MILIDTHVWLRWIAPQEQPLPAQIVAHLEEADDVAVSAISCWELAYLHQRGRVVLPLPLRAWLEEALDGSGISCIDLTAVIAMRAATLSDIHRDPADRFIIATAIESNCTLVTLDTTIRQYPELAGLLT